MTDSPRTSDAEKRRRRMMLLALAGAAAAALLLYLLLRAANEPTIIVKGNSIDFELAEAEWVQAGQRHWTHNGSESDSEQYMVRLETEGKEKCPEGPGPVRRIAIDSNGPLRVIMRFSNKRTQVHHPAGNLTKQSAKLLASDGGEVVSHIRMWEDAAGQGQADWQCSFSASRTFKQLDVTDH